MKPKRVKKKVEKSDPIKLLNDITKLIATPLPQKQKQKETTIDPTELSWIPGSRRKRNPPITKPILIPSPIEVAITPIVSSKEPIRDWIRYFYRNELNVHEKTTDELSHFLQSGTIALVTGEHGSGKTWCIDHVLQKANVLKIDFNSIYDEMKFQNSDLKMETVFNRCLFTKPNLFFREKQQDACCVIDPLEEITPIMRQLITFIENEYRKCDGNERGRQVYLPLNKIIIVTVDSFAKPCSQLIKSLGIKQRSHHVAPLMDMIQVKQVYYRNKFVNVIADNLNCPHSVIEKFFGSFESYDMNFLLNQLQWKLTDPDFSFEQLGQHTGNKRVEPTHDDMYKLLLHILNNTSKTWDQCALMWSKGDMYLIDKVERNIHNYMFGDSQLLDHLSRSDKFAFEGGGETNYFDVLCAQGVRLLRQHKKFEGKLQMGFEVTRPLFRIPSHYVGSLEVIREHISMLSNSSHYVWPDAFLWRMYYGNEPLEKESRGMSLFLKWLSDANPLAPKRKQVKKRRKPVEI